MAMTLCLVLMAMDGRAAGTAMNARDFLQLCWEAMPQAVQAALAGCADANARAQEDSRTALMLAAFNSNPEVIRLLIEAGAKVNARDNQRAR